MSNKIRKISLPLLALLLSPLLAGAPLLHAASVGDDKASAIKGHQKVVIAEFGVEFYTQLHSEGRGGSGSNAQVTAVLNGVSDDTMHAVTQQAYTDTIASLQKAGFEVVDPATLKDNPKFPELEKKYGAPSPYTFTDDSFFEGQPTISKVFAPEGMQAFLSTSVGRGNFSQRTDSQNQGRGDKEGELAKELDVTLLHVHYLASFGTVAASKNNPWLGGAAKARASFEAQPVLFPEDTEFQFVTDAGKRTFTNSKRPRHTGAVYLKEPLIASANIFNLQDNTPAETKKSDMIGNAIGGLLGVGGQKRKALEVQPASEEAFKTGYQVLILDAADSMSQALAAGR
jgi:hypothetical protein